MDGVKVTYIETQFVTSDAAGFKDLVQRLTGRSTAATGAGAAPPAHHAAPHRPRACRAGAACGRSAAAAADEAGPQGYYFHASPPAAAHEARVGDGRLGPPCLDETYGIEDFSDLLFGCSSQNGQCGLGGYYSDHFPC